jgi:hypothetical protein
MFTTAGDTALAMSLNVLAVSGPVKGALFIGGAWMVCAPDSGDNPSRDAITSPTASDATAIRSA